MTLADNGISQRRGRFLFQKLSYFISSSYLSHPTPGSGTFSTEVMGKLWNRVHLVAFCAFFRCEGGNEFGLGVPSLIF